MKALLLSILVALAASGCGLDSRPATIEKPNSAKAQEQAQKGEPIYEKRILREKVPVEIPVKEHTRKGKTVKAHTRTEYKTRLVEQNVIVGYKPLADEKPTTTQPTAKPLDDEKLAENLLKAAKTHLDQPNLARKWLTTIVEKHSDTESAKEAREMLATIENK
jgi:hypothetical protein